MITDERTEECCRWPSQRVYYSFVLHRIPYQGSLRFSTALDAKAAGDVAVGAGRGEMRVYVSFHHLEEADMGFSPSGMAAITLFTENLDETKLFYEDVLGLPVHFEDSDSVVFRFGETLINLLEVTAAADLIAPGVVAPRNSGSRFQLTVRVEDVDAMCAELTRRGVRFLNGPMQRPWGPRTASFTDPGGHIWEIAS